MTICGVLRACSLAFLIPAIGCHGRADDPGGNAPLPKAEPEKTQVRSETGTTRDEIGKAPEEDAHAITEEKRQIILDSLHDKDWKTSRASLVEQLRRDYGLSESFCWRYIAFLCFETARSSDPAEERYAWVRRAVAILVEGTEATQFDADMLMNLGTVLMRPLGRHHPESPADRPLRDLFIADQPLQERLQSIVDLDQGRQEDGALEPFLIAELVFRRVLRELDDHPEREPPLMEPAISSFPLQCRIRLAQSLDQTDRHAEAAAAWTNAARQFKEYGERPVRTPTGVIRLSDSPEEKWVRQMRSVGRYEDYQRLIATEQSEDMRAGWRLLHEAKTMVAAADNPDKTRCSIFDEAFQRFGQALSSWKLDDAVEWFEESLPSAIIAYEQECFPDGKLPRNFPLKSFHERWIRWRTPVVPAE